MRSTVVVALAALAIIASGCDSSDEKTPDPDTARVSADVIAVTVEDQVGDVGGPRTFAGKFPPADLSSLGYGWSKDGLTVAWTVGEVLDKDADHAQVFGVDATTADGEMLFSVRYADGRALVRDATGFAHPCPQATSTSNDDTLTAVIPADCVGTHEQFSLSGNVTALSTKKVGRLDAFDLVAGGQILVTADNKPLATDSPDETSPDEVTPDSGEPSQASPNSSVPAPQELTGPDSPGSDAEAETGSGQ